MHYPPQVGASVQHKIFGKGLITKIRKAGPTGVLEIVVRFSKTSNKTATFSVLDFDTFFILLAPEEAAAEPVQNESKASCDVNKARIKELEERLALSNANKKPPR